MRLFSRRKKQEEQEQEEEHWAVPAFRAIEEIVDTEPKRFFKKGRHKTSWISYKVVGLPELELDVDVNDNELRIRAPEELILTDSHMNIATRIGQKIRNVTDTGSYNTKLASFMADYIKGESFTLLQRPPEITEKLYTGLQRCEGDYLVTSRYIWFSKSSDASMTKLILSEEERCV